jgi:hypothetical protein
MWFSVEANTSPLAGQAADQTSSKELVHRISPFNRREDDEFLSSPVMKSGW